MLYTILLCKVFKIPTPCCRIPSLCYAINSSCNKTSHSVSQVWRAELRQLERSRRQNWEQGLSDFLFSQLQLCYSIPVLRQVAVPGSITWEQRILTAPLAKHLLIQQAKWHLLHSAESRKCSCRRAVGWSLPAHPTAHQLTWGPP